MHNHRNSPHGARMRSPSTSGGWGKCPRAPRPAYARNRDVADRYFGLILFFIFFLLKSLFLQARVQNFNTRRLWRLPKVIGWLSKKFWGPRASYRLDERVQGGKRVLTVDISSGHHNKPRVVCGAIPSAHARFTPLP